MFSIFLQSKKDLETAFVFSRRSRCPNHNGGHKYLRKCETQASFRCFYWRKNVLISSGKSNGAKIRIWSKSLGTRLLTTTGFIEIP